MKLLKDALVWLFGLVFHNFITKLLCLFMAFLLYVYVNTSENVDRDFSLPLSIANRPDHVLVTSQSASDVRVVVNGPKAKMDQLKANDLTVTLSLQDVQGSGEVGFRLYTDQVSTPSGIRVRSIEPASVTLKLEPTEARNVEVRPRIEGAPKEGYEVAEVRVETPVIEVFGPPSILGAMDALETDVVDVAGMTGSFKQRVDFRIPNLVSIGGSRRWVVVAVSIREKTLQRTLEDLPVRAASERKDLQIEPHTVSVELQGPYSIIQSLTPAQIVPVVMEEGLIPGQPGKRPVTLRAVPPQRVEIRVHPPEVLVTVPTPLPVTEPSPAPATVEPGDPPKPAKPARTPRPTRAEP